MRSSITGRRLFAKGAVVIAVGMLMEFPTVEVRSIRRMTFLGTRANYRKPACIT